MTRLSVVGLLPVQMHYLRQQCRKLPLRLDYVPKERSAPAFPKGTNGCLLFIDFIDHCWSKAALKHYGRPHCLVHRGGLKSACSLLHEVFRAG